MENENIIVMWDTLISAFDKEINNLGSSHLESILNMIQRNLTFDAPGLFSYSLLDPEYKQRLEVCNLWLFNQLIYLLTDEKTTRVPKANIDLQKYMIAGCGAKLRWFFMLIVKKFITLSDLLILNNNYSPEEDLNIDMFNMEDKFNCKFLKIKISSIKSKTILMGCCVEILTSSLIYYRDFDKKLQQRSNLIVYTAFNDFGIEIKIVCLEYFIKLQSKHTYDDETDDNIFEEHNNRVLIGILSTLQKFNKIHIDDNTISLYNLFLKNSISIVKKLPIKNNFIESSNLEILIEISKLKFNCENLLFSKLCNEIIIYLKRFFVKNPNYQLKNFNENFDLIYYQQILFVYENLVIYDLQNDSKFNLWNTILNDMFNVFAIDLITSEHINKSLDIIKIILKFIIDVKFKLNVNSIMNIELNEFKFLNDRFNDFVEYFFKIIEIVTIQQFFNELINIIEISSYICIIDEFQYLSYDNKEKLIQLVLLPYLKLLPEDIFSKNHNENLVGIITKFDTINDLELSSLKSILNISIYLDRPIYNNIRKKLNKSIEQILLHKLTINPLNKEIKNKIIKIIIYNILNTSSKLNCHMKILNLIYDNANLHLEFTQNLKLMICLFNENNELYLVKSFNQYEIQLKCLNCDRSTENIFKNSYVLNRKLNLDPEYKYELQNALAKFFLLIGTTESNIKLNMIKLLPSMYCHTNYHSTDWIEFILDDGLDVRMALANHFEEIFNAIQTNSKLSSGCKQNIIEKCLKNHLIATDKCLLESTKNLQSCVLNSLVKFSECGLISEENFFSCFRIAIMFMLHSGSHYAREAAFSVTTMCLAKNLKPINIFYWYKEKILKIIISMSVYMYLSQSICLNRSLSYITKMLGFTGPRDFLSKHYKLILAIILPYCIKYPPAKELLTEISRVVQKDISECLASSFLTIYPYLFINESAEVNNQCIDFIIQNTGSTLYNLLQSDIKKSVAEILVYYNKSHECIFRALRSILSKSDDVTNSEKVTCKDMVQYIAERFLGILTYFESSLLHLENECNMKKETLLSLGSIIRFLGAHHITPFRFKIIAMLKTSLTVEIPNLSDVCVKVWAIFIHTVDIQSLGPLLSTIFVSIEPLLKNHEAEVNDIAKYLVISNESLLSIYIQDLFFIHETSFSESIKAAVTRKTDKIVYSNFRMKLQSMLNHIYHDNLEVRIYGLKYLKVIFKRNRVDLNHLIVGQNNMNSILEDCIESLMQGCKHSVENLQLAAGQCLGELGALEPSLIPPNYAPQVKFALSIHTDLFAIMALEALCRAYQFQKDTKYVDNFSLAIQEILLERQVSPKNNQKLEVWEAIPERMRPLMEPLLTSCYTDYRKNTVIRLHPIFRSSRCRTYEDWAVTWSNKMIEFVQNEDTRRLLQSFRPSIKRNMNILSMFFPYILVHALQNCTEDERIKIYEEINIVFESKVLEVDHHHIIDMGNSRTFKSSYFNSSLTKPQTKFQEYSTYVTKCAKLAFNQLDFLTHWLRQYSKVYSTGDEQNIKTIELFLNKFDKKLVAEANFKCNEYARALMYIESYIEENPEERLQSELSFLAKIYAELMNPDSLEGAMNLKTTEPTLKEQILANNMKGCLHESALCFEHLLEQSDMSPSNMVDLVQCYLDLELPDKALLIVEGLLSKICDANSTTLLQECKAETLWRLSRFDELDELVTISEIQDSPKWGVKCGQLLLNIRKENFNEFDNIINTTRLNILHTLRTAEIEQNTYHKGYTDVMKLHFLNEFDSIRNIVKRTDRFIDVKDDVILITNLFSEWDLRLELLQPTSKVMEPMLCLRRKLLQEMKQLIEKNCSNQSAKTNLINNIDQYIGKMWIKSTELARTAGKFQQASLYILNAEQYKNKELVLEKAKLFWSKGEQSKTFRILEREIKTFKETENFNTKALTNERKFYAEANLLIAIYNAESMNIETNLNLKYFKEAAKYYQDHEKSWVHLAQYSDRIYGALTEENQQSDKGMAILQDIMLFYGKSMFYGCNYIYQSMPRMLSVWLDFTAKMKHEESYKKCCEKMNRMAESFCNLIPSFVFFTAFSQLVSRICHPSVDVYIVIKTILVKLITDFPQQSLWMISSVFKSSYPSRVKRCSEVFQDKRLAQADIQTLITDFNSLAEKLIELTNKTIPTNDKHPTVSSLVPVLPKLFSTHTFSQFILPIQQHMLPTLPPTCKRDAPAGSFNAFPNHLVNIKGIKEEITILLSLQRPRKVTFLGDDGKEYFVMMKPKDDLRKDFRLMEFNAVVKEYLHQDPDARERRLNIRTYAVIPLNEECGIIEWVSNLQSFRSIIISIYKERNSLMTNREIRNAQCEVRDPIEKKREVFLKTLLPKHPPVFAEWFKRQFSTPHNWYEARSSYIKTTAVMSMVGYILGLGDRHGENILYDAKNGDTVHVDFNCLFNKGETFDYPEKVPFRLTHNMTHAMGPLGVEGLYRRCCEITLKILRAQKPTLMSVLKPFVYDPLVTWSRSSKSDRVTERTDPRAMINVKEIEERLKGFVKICGKTNNMALSAEGQVNSIISESMNIDNLASMYIGWGAYM